MMHLTKRAALALCLAAITIPAAGWAETSCGQRDAVLKKLAKSYGETRQSAGLGNGNALIEVFASDETGTWTITVTKPDGTTCLMASGQAYQALDERSLLDEDA